MTGESTSLGSKLAPLLQDGFFRPLSRPTATVYVDCADRLTAAADEGGQVLYDEARLLIREVLTQHPDKTSVGIHLDAAPSRASDVQAVSLRQGCQLFSLQ